MSKAKKENQESDVFLKQVRLKNYKSIIDAEIEFKHGLNIIIGNNGSGKTNFLNYMQDVLDIEWGIKPELKAEFTLVKKDNSYKFIVDKKRDIEIAHSKSLDEILNKKKISFKVFINDDLQDESEVHSEDFYSKIDNSLDYNLKFINYGVPREQDIVEKPVRLIFSSSSLDSSDVKIRTKFIESLIAKLAYPVFFYKQAFGISKLKTVVEELNVFFDNVREALKIYTDIDDLRISPNFNLYFNKDRNEINMHNLFLEFFLNGNWVPYSSLSDGSKRLFYIISEIISDSEKEVLIRSHNLKDLNESTSPAEIILLEEPELGIHPHQLHKLMLFIKEQSRKKQIILTTHSPQVLNILGPDELDSIILCSYDQQKGTQLNHLTERQVSKGQNYMQDEGFLSDYWIYSDLEPVI